MLRRATYTGVEAIMDAYDALNEAGYPFSVWHSEKSIAFQYTGTDAKKGRDFLEDNLKAMSQAKNDDLLYLKFHPAVNKKTGWIDRSTAVISETPVRAFAVEDIDYMRGTDSPRPTSGAVPAYLIDVITDLKALPAKIDERLTKVEEYIDYETVEPESEPIPEIDPVEKWVNIISGLSQNEKVMSVVGTILSYFKPPVFNPIRTPMNGTESEQPPAQSETVRDPSTIDKAMVNESLERLNKHCHIDTDLKLLADMADSDPGKFQFLLQMLRK